MIEKTQAIVLRVYPYSNTSHIVHWLSAEHGKLATLVKGATRPRSAFLGQYDLFYTCELLYYSRPNRALHLTRECSALSPRPRLRVDWRATACASYVCDLVNRSLLEGQAQPRVYPLTEAALDALCDGVAGMPFLFWFEFKLMQALGYAPSLGRCCVCHEAQRPGDDPPTVFSCQHGGIVCPRCTLRASGNDTLAIRPDVLAIARSWQESESPWAARNTRCTPRQMADLRKLHGDFLDYHLDLATSSRDIALQLAGFPS
jgi:DNA repair protein RecO (recombination protein O)